MLPYGYTALTHEEWRIIKATTRRAAFERRMAEADEAGADNWLAAVERDDRTDPYEHPRDRDVSHKEGRSYDYHH